MFQSLFYWKYHFNLRKEEGGIECYMVSILILLEVPLQLLHVLFLIRIRCSFNPYFTGSTTSTLIDGAVEVKGSEFQSLFYWKYHFNNMSDISLSSQVAAFQSLFYWKYHFNLCSSCLSSKLIFLVFQSLFYWKYHFNNSYRRPNTSREKFQSLFYWKYHFNPFHH